MAKNLLVTYPLRLPPDLKQQLEQAAAKSGKSLRQEILDRLLATFAQPVDSVSDRLAAIEARLTVIEGAAAKRR